LKSKSFNFDEFLLSKFPFYVLWFLCPKKFLPIPRLQNFSLIVSPRSSIMFRSMIHLDCACVCVCVCVCVAKEIPRLIFLYMDIQLFQHHLMKRLSFSHWVTLALLSKINSLYICGSISRISILFYLFMFLLMPTPVSPYYLYYSKS
jgi:hypothetical protein